MKAVRCQPPGIMIQDDAPKPGASTTEICVRVKLAGICRTGLELTRGYMGFTGILGHEFIGVIDDANAPWPKGARVVGEINAGCGECPECKRNMQRHCPNRSVLGILNRSGCMAEWLSLPAENLLRVPDPVSDPQAVFTEPLAAALEIFEQMHIEPTERVCIIGDGKLGLLIAMTFALRHEGASLLIGHHQNKLDLVSDLLQTSVEQEPNSTINRQWDVVVDATGSSAGLRRAMQLVKPRGRIVLKSTMAQAEPIDLTPLVIDEVTVVGSRCGQFAPALAFLERQKPPVERLVEATYPFDQAAAAWEHAQTPGAKKVLLSF